MELSKTKCLSLSKVLLAENYNYTLKKAAATLTC